MADPSVCDRTSSPAQLRAFKEYERTPARSACIASTPAVPLFCSLCTLTSTRPSSLSLPSCGRRASSDHHNLTACGHIVAFLVRRERPDSGANSQHSVLIAVRRAVANLSGFVLGDLVLRMLLAVLAFAIGASRFRYINLINAKHQHRPRQMYSFQAPFKQPSPTIILLGAADESSRVVGASS